MRQIKFRGQIKDTKEWVYGYLIIKTEIIRIEGTNGITGDVYYIINDENTFKVIPETVGQFVDTFKGFEGDVYCENCSFYILTYNSRLGGFLMVDTKTKKFAEESSFNKVGNIYDATEEQKKEWGL
jgi:hypothetical protein